MKYYCTVNDGTNNTYVLVSKDSKRNCYLGYHVDMEGYFDPDKYVYNTIQARLIKKIAKSLEELKSNE